MVLPQKENVPKSVTLPGSDATVRSGYPMLASSHPLAAPQQSLQARQQDRQIERLGQIIVGAGGEAFQHIFGTARAVSISTGT